MNDPTLALWSEPVEAVRNATSVADSNTHAIRSVTLQQQFRSISLLAVNLAQHETARQVIDDQYGHCMMVNGDLSQNG
jgi:hypothetical protein